MNNLALEAIKESEKKSEKNLIKAREDAEKTVIQAEKQKEKRIAEVEKEHQKNRDELLEQTRQEAKKDIDALAKKAFAEKQKIEQFVSQNKDKAVDIVVNEMLK